MTRCRWIVSTVLTTAVTAAAVAHAQPAEPAPPEPGPATGSGSAVTPPPPTAAPPEAAPPAPTNPYGEEPPPPPPKPKVKDPPVPMPMVLTTPTGWLLPAAVLYSRNALDTGGGFTTDNRVGLGDVAEFGVATTDEVRARQDVNDKTPERIQPYVAATFRMGVAEDRLFEGQPGLVLGFRKSFERNHDGFKTRIAELTLVASKKLGTRTAIHVGGAFWDASLQGEGIDTTLHDRTDHSIGDQIRAFGGLQVQPLEKSEILIDIGWAPEFCYKCAAGDQIRLVPQLSWGVRYHVADFMRLESGVRVPDIGDANLLNAQIFGQVTFTSWGLRHAVDNIK